MIEIWRKAGYSLKGFYISLGILAVWLVGWALTVPLSFRGTCGTGLFFSGTHPCGLGEYFSEAFGWLPLIITFSAPYWIPVLILPAIAGWVIKIMKAKRGKQKTTIPS